MSAYEYMSEWNDILSSGQVLTNHLHKYFCLRALVNME